MSSKGSSEAVHVQCDIRHSQPSIHLLPMRSLTICSGCWPTGLERTFQGGGFGEDASIVDQHIDLA